MIRLGVMQNVQTYEELTELLRSNGMALWAPTPDNDDARDRSIIAYPAADGHWDLPIARPRTDTDQEKGIAGLVRTASGFVVTEDLYQRLCKDIQVETSEIRRYSTRPISRTFVFVDVSGFSQMPSGVQLLVVIALVRLSNARSGEVKPPEAELCIGDGYIYVFEDALNAVLFSADLATRIEDEVATEKAPEFHFRIGIHSGPVRWFWDPGRRDWNYIGDGINGAQRVLGAIGKDTDDVVFASAEVRQSILIGRERERLIAAFDNKGRVKDKHGDYWRVYRINHSAVWVND